MVTVSKKQVSKTLIFELPGVKNCISRWCTNPLGDPPPPRISYPNRVKNTHIQPKTCFTYLGWSFWVVTTSNKQVSKTSIFELPRVKTAQAGCVPAHSLGHYCWKQSFRVFGTGCERPQARLETAKIVLPYPSRHILSQHPHLHPSEWVPRGHRGRQNRQHSKNG